MRRFFAAAVAAVSAFSALAGSAAPAAGQAGGFGDVAEEAYYSAPVLALAGLGVFAGTECDEGFCPDVPIDRKTMAVWTVRMLDGQDPPTIAETRFSDVDAAGFFAPFIERMAELGVTVGCGDGSGFCPDDNVIRAQMAVFLSRAYDLEEGPDPGFSDVPDEAWYANDVARLAASGITVGCGDGSAFCPRQPTARGEMATFLKRAYTRFVGPCPSESDTPTGGGGGGGGGGGFFTEPTQPVTLAPDLLSVDVDPGDGTLTVRWAAPELPVGLSVYAYRLRWKGPGQSYSDTERWDSTSDLSYRIGGLTNGAKYSVQVAAGIVGEGFSSWSEASGVSRTEPGAPRSVRVDAGDEMLTARWQAPADDGGSAVTGYRVRWLIASVLAGEENASGLVHEIGGLTNTVEYDVQVAAVNAAGAGAWSEGAAGTPVGPPDAPRLLRAERGDRSVTVTWQAPADNGGSAVTGYRVQWRTGDQSFSPSSRQKLVAADNTRYEIGGLANGTQHFVRVLAVNDLGDGDAPAEVPVTPATIPDPPRGLRAERGDRSVTVTWQAPADGGSAVTGYVVEWSDDHFDQSVHGQPLDASALEYLVEGLVNGTQYSVRVLAVNDVGQGGAAPAVPATPASAPGVPSGVGAALGNGLVTVSWGAPDHGGSPITGYTVQWRDSDDHFEDSDPSVTAGGDTLSRRIGSLTNGTEYFVQVRATNDVGTGPWSASASATPATVAGPPQSVEAVAASMSVTVTWSEPTDGSGPAVTGYRVQWRAQSDGYSPAREAVTGPNDRSLQISGLSNGTKYFVRVIARNSIGDGVVSEEVSATPATTPNVPGSVLAMRGDEQLRVTWVAPDDGGSPIIGYRLQRSRDDQFDSSDAEVRVSGTAVSRYLGSLTNGTRYWVRILARNSVGPGPWSSVESAVPARAPDAPRSVSASPGDRSITVNWEPPGYEGGLPVTGYVVEWSDDQFDQTVHDQRLEATAEQYLVERLVNGTQYQVRVRAMSDAGEGAASPARSAIPVTVPGEWGAVTLEARDRSLNVSWEAPDDGGSAVIEYRVQWSTDDQFDSSDPEVPVSGTAVSRQIGSLINGTRYWVQILARNSVGDGPWSSVVSAVPARPPGVPRSVSASPGDESITVSWQEPADDGGSAVIGYRVQWRADGDTFGTDRQAIVSGTDHPISDLRNGEEYWVQVEAANVAGYGLPASASGVPRTVPGAPGVPVIHSASGAFLVSWDPPDSDGGLEVTAYRVQWKGPDEAYNETDRLATVTSPSHQITGLNRGTEYTVRIAAMNAAGYGPAVEKSAVVADPPGAPTSTAVHVRNLSLFVTWSPPDTDGGSEIEHYDVLWKNQDQVFDDSSCSKRKFTVLADRYLGAVVGPLANDTSYDVRVVAVNDSGPGEPADSSGVPLAVPGPPIALGAFAVDDGLVVDWVEPWDGGSPITGYEVQWKAPDQDYSADRQALITDVSNLSYEITGLSDSVEYTARVRAFNANGSSRYVDSTGLIGDAPGRPTVFTVTPLVYVLQHYQGFSAFGFEFSWEAPADTGGSAMTSYYITWARLPSGVNSGRTYRDASELSYEFHQYCRGGCEGRLYYFEISAINSDGVGPPARAEAAVVHAGQGSG